jgi:heme/copper-type cytochrome/quinol oxidase subunit 2
MKRLIKLVSVVFGASYVLALGSGVSTAFAQCAMCKAAAAASGNSALNTAILVLLIPPVVIFCAIFIVAYRMRNTGENPPATAGGTDKKA